MQGREIESAQWRMGKEGGKVFRDAFMGRSFRLYISIRFVHALFEKTVSKISKVEHSDMPCKRAAGHESILSSLVSVEEIRRLFKEGGRRLYAP